MKLNSKFDRSCPTIIVVPLKMHRRCIICGQEPSDHFVYPRNLTEARRWQSLVNMNSVNVEPESLCRHGCVCSSHLDVVESSSNDLANFQIRSCGGMPPRDCRSRCSIDRRPNIKFASPTEMFLLGAKSDESQKKGNKTNCTCDNGGPCNRILAKKLLPYCSSRWTLPLLNGAQRNRRITEGQRNCRKGNGRATTKKWPSAKNLSQKIYRLTDPVAARIPQTRELSRKSNPKVEA